MLIFEERGKPEANLSGQIIEPTTSLTHLRPRVLNRTQTTQQVQPPLLNPCSPSIGEQQDLQFFRPLGAGRNTRTPTHNDYQLPSRQMLSLPQPHSLTFYRPSLPRPQDNPSICKPLYPTFSSFNPFFQVRIKASKNPGHDRRLHVPFSTAYGKRAIFKKMFFATPKCALTRIEVLRKPRSEKAGRKRSKTCKRIKCNTS